MDILPNDESLLYDGGDYWNIYMKYCYMYKYLHIYPLRRIACIPNNDKHANLLWIYARPIKQPYYLVTT